MLGWLVNSCKATLVEYSIFNSHQQTFTDLRGWHEQQSPWTTLLWETIWKADNYTLDSFQSKTSSCSQMLRWGMLPLHWACPETSVKRTNNAECRLQNTGYSNFLNSNSVFPKLLKMCVLNHLQYFLNSHFYMTPLH